MFLVALLGLFISQGCNTTQQRTAYNTIGALEAVAQGTVNGYFQLVIQGVVPTNDVPTVSKSFNSFQASATLAASVAQAGTNAVAPVNLQTEFSNFTNLVFVISKKGK